MIVGPLSENSDSGFFCLITSCLIEVVVERNSYKTFLPSMHREKVFYLEKS
jgi:hypothetical protein